VGRKRYGEGVAVGGGRVRVAVAGTGVMDGNGVLVAVGVCVDVGDIGDEVAVQVGVEVDGTGEGVVVWLGVADGVLPDDTDAVAVRVGMGVFVTIAGWALCWMAV
jgi:hypothetical protein